MNDGTTDSTKSCPFCGVALKAGKYDNHVSRKCPRSPQAMAFRAKHGQPGSMGKFSGRPPNPGVGDGAAVPKKVRPTVVQVRSRLERLYRDLESAVSQPDNLELAKEFKAFYIYYVCEGRARGSGVLRAPALNADGTRSVSVKAWSGGLPSLGKKAK